MQKFYVLLVCLLLTFIGSAQMPVDTIRFGAETQLSKASFRGAAFAHGIALVSGSEGHVYKAIGNDQPFNWKKLLLPSICDSLQFRDVAILSKTDYLLMSVGEGASSQIWKTNDGGKQWIKVYQNQLAKAFFNGFDFWDDQRGVLISDPIDDKVYLLKTNDGGHTWQRIQSKSLPVLIDKEYGFAASGTGIQCFGQNNIAVGTGGSVARIFNSADGGKTWQVTATPMLQGADSKGIFSVNFLNEKVAMAVGGDYADDQLAGHNIIQLNKKGDWESTVAANKVGFKSCVHLLNDDLIIATGTSGTVFSTNAGNSWQIVGGVKGYHTIAYQPKLKKGVLAGSEGRVVMFWVK